MITLTVVLYAFLVAAGTSLIALAIYHRYIGADNRIKARILANEVTALRNRVQATLDGEAQ